jgi:hypothetical protein
MEQVEAKMKRDTPRALHALARISVPRVLMSWFAFGLNSAVGSFERPARWMTALQPSRTLASNVRRSPWTRSIEDADGFALVEELPDRDAADVPGAARDENHGRNDSLECEMSRITRIDASQGRVL